MSKYKKIAAISIILIFIGNTFALADDQSKCQFSSITLTKDLNYFLNNLSSSWQFDYARGASVAEAYEICKQRQKNDGFDSIPYITPCFFRSIGDSYFSGLWIFSRDGKLERLDMSFNEDQIHKIVYEELVSAYGHPTREFEYNEERFTHNLREWRVSNCKIIYDFGGIGASAPVRLMLVNLPRYQGDFNIGTASERLLQ